MQVNFIGQVKEKNTYIVNIWSKIILGSPDTLHKSGRKTNILVFD